MDDREVRDSGSNTSANSPRGTRSVAIASTFTAHPVREPLEFLLQALAVDADVAFAPYGQIMQELLHPRSLLAENKTGLNVLLVRLDDWIRDRTGEGIESNVAHLRRACDELLAGVRALRDRSPAETLLFLCPLSSELAEYYREPLLLMQRQLVSTLDSLPNVYCLAHSELARLYPVTDHEDERSDRIGHVPYTPEYFVALALLLARRIATLCNPRPKVIALDCDNTLWRGICGEDGTGGIVLTSAHLRFQRLLVEQYEAGVLLCLCSKNNQTDIDSVFASRVDMPLQPHHLICSRVNWDAKSANLISLSQELELSTDSFIFIDDSPMECAEVRQGCPEVLTLCFPQQEADIEYFLNHTWAFDRRDATEEAGLRTQLYRQNRERKVAREQMADLAQFLASLELSVTFAPPDPQELARVAELVQRTNQFNLTTVRRTAAEIESLKRSCDLDVLVIHVSDRFGDYGLVGAVLYRHAGSVLEVDTFVLSCRVLGRGVEHRIVSELGRLARRKGAASVALRYRPTARNVPARSFLHDCFGRFRTAASADDPSAELTFDVPIDEAERLTVMAAPAAALDGEATHVDTRPAGGRSSSVWLEAARKLSSVPTVIEEMRRAKRRARQMHTEYVTARTADEAAIAAIWADLLRVGEVGVRDDFFELGGDSLLAVQAVSRIAAQLERELPLATFFSEATPEGVARQLATAQRIEQPIERVAVTGPMPLSSAQRRLWFIDHLERGGAAYHIPLALRLLGPLDLAALVAALDALIQRQSALRTRFCAIDGEPMQEVCTPGFSLSRIDLRGQDAEEIRVLVDRHMVEEGIAPFDLRAGAPIRGRLLQLSATEHLLLITMHHIVSDGWSIGIFIREIGALYEACRSGSSSPLSQLPLQYSDYALWQRRSADTERMQQQLNYWRSRLQGAPELLELPIDRARPNVQSYRGASVHVALGAELSVRLRTFSRQRQLTLAMVLYAAWAILLKRLSGRDDLVIGMPVANRRRQELEALIGFFVNTLAVRVAVPGDRRVADLLQDVKQTMLQAYANQDAPFESVVEALQPARSLSFGPVVQVMFVLQNAPVGTWPAGKLTLEQQDVQIPAAQFDLTLSLHDVPEEIRGTLTYATDLFDHATIESWARCFGSVVESLVREPDARVDQVPLLDAAQRQQIVQGFNATDTVYPRTRRIHELFEEQVVRTPEIPAVVDDSQVLTYTQLNEQANRLARCLQQRGVRIGECIPVLMARSSRSLVAQLAILKCGAVYVPIDAELPAERIRFVIQDCGARHSLVDSAAAAQGVDEVEWIDCASGRELDGATAGTNLALRIDASPAAYVMYTSGSTGVPKGVLVPHDAVSRLVINNGYAQIDAADCIAHHSNLAFDASTFEIWGALLSGARVLIVPQDVLLDAERFAAMLARHAVTILYLSVGLFNQYAEVLGGVFARLSYLLVGGDALDPEIIRRVLEVNPPRCLLNAYGPTECTTFTTTHRIESVAEAATSIPIGRPMSNARVYILDLQRQAVPIGAVGELYIGGAGVARGYLNRPELTAERFLPDPFGAEAGARMYRTGDLARWRSDGTIEFLGRNDQQVKIRGFRVELGEIEAQLARHKQVKLCVVVVRDAAGAGRQLTAYVVARDPAVLDLADLRAHLRAKLPEYMVPSTVVVLADLPLTPNGKVDRRALPAPEQQAYASRQYEPPQGDMEQNLADIWQALLGLERVGRHDNFFELGGHSLLIVQMMDKLRRGGLSTEVRRVFESPTLADLAGALRTGPAGHGEVPPSLIAPDCTAITPRMLPLVQLEAHHIERIVAQVPGGAANVQDIYPLAPLQEGILFHHLIADEGAGDIYVLPTLLSVASREAVQRLRDALQEVVDRHDVLRTAILWEQLPAAVQVVLRRANVVLEDLALEPAQDLDSQIHEWLSPGRLRIDLHRAPLLRLQAACSGDGKWFALVQVHHIVADGQSLRAVVCEVIDQLAGRAPDRSATLPYRNHVAHALAYARTHDADAFFRGKLADVEESSAPFGLLDVHGRVGHIEQSSQALPADLARRVRATARRMNMSAATLFHAAWGLVVAATSGREDVVFGSVLLGRLQAGMETHHMLGMFVNTLPLRLRLDGVSAKELVEQTQRELIELLGHEQASLAAAQRCSGISGGSPLFTSLLNYRHTPRTLDAEWAADEDAGVEVIASRGFTNYPVTVSVDDLGEGFELTAQTDRRIEAVRVIGYVCTALESLMQALEQAPQSAALSLGVIPAQEWRELLEVFNATQVPYPRQKRIHELFEEQVRRTPHAVAVHYAEQSLTYAQLNAAANAVARYLRGKAVGRDELVGICVERSPAMVVGLLGILKAGGAYVPLDPSYPPERLQYMLEDAAPSVVLTQASLREVLPATSAELGDVQVLLEQLQGTAENLEAAEEATAQDLLYVIYTSGSTGRPKGTEMSHGAMVNLIEWHRSVFGEGSARVLQFAALSFDVAFQETFTTLCTGGTLVLLDEWVRRDARALLELLNRQSVERLFVPPLLLQSLAEYCRVSDVVPGCLKDVITAGEQLRISAEIVGLFERLPAGRLHNHYGPTETHVVTALTLSGDPRGWPSLPTIGAAIANTQIYILDRARRPVPLGVIGEIYIGGASLARGYLHCSELTAERFVPDPFGAERTARMYKTGDLGRWRADATIEYLGRNDDQVKIRGFRIELGEIEARLALHPQVREAAVIVREDVPGEKRLVAYLTARAEQPPATEELREHLKATLPEHMVPSAFVVLQSMPLTPSGKLSRRALPPPEPDAYAGRAYHAPQGELEQALAAIWRQLLHVERVGRNDNFFDLGGHSLLAMQVAARVHGTLNVELPIKMLFACPTVQELSTQIESLRAVSQLEAGDLQDLLDTVSSLPDSTVQQLLQQLSMEGRV